jgi:hypothetical protein
LILVVVVVVVGFSSRHHRRCSAVTTTTTTTIIAFSKPCRGHFSDIGHDVHNLHQMKAATGLNRDDVARLGGDLQHLLPRFSRQDGI